MNYSSQRDIFKKAIAEGWPGQEPAVLKTYTANEALNEAEKYLATGYRGIVKSVGQIAYEGYFNHSQGKSLISGAALPTWDAQADAIKAAWEAAAGAVLESGTQENT